jgi:hypothetical protein
MVMATFRFYEELNGFLMPERRIVLKRDRELLKRRPITHGFTCVRYGLFDSEIADI